MQVPALTTISNLLRPEDSLLKHSIKMVVKHKKSPNRLLMKNNKIKNLHNKLKKKSIIKYKKS